MARRSDNDPKIANTDPWGTKLTNALANEGKFFCIRDPNKEIRGLSQSFDPGVSFGLESEQPDCAANLRTGIHFARSPYHLSILRR